MSLYRKYRPSTFSEVVGQTHIVKTLSNAIKHNRIGHAYLFTGPRGTGKTTLARIFAKAINCNDPQKSLPKAASIAIDVEPCTKCETCKLIQDNRAMDLIEIDAASHTGVDNIRQLKETVVLPPIALKYKVYIIDEVHMLSMGAFNALLKTLEEPPAHAVFILATTELHKIPETILSRCQRFDFSRMTQDQIIGRLKQIAASEKVKIEDEALETIALEAEGGMRDAESILGQIIALEDKEITTTEVNQILGTSSKRLSIDFVELLLQDKVSDALQQIEQVQADGVNLKNFNKNILVYLRNLLILKTSPEATQLVSTLTTEQVQQAKEAINSATLQELLLLVDLFQKSLNDYKNASIPQLPLEMAAIEYHVSKNAPAPSAAPATAPQPNPMPTQPRPIADKPRRSSNDSGERQGQPPIAPPSQPDEPTQPDTPSLPQSNASIEVILDKWNEILEGVKPYNHSIHAFLKNCVPAGIIEGKLYIKTKYEYYKDKLNEPTHKGPVQAVIANIIQGTLKINYITEEEAEKMKFPVAETPAENHNILHDAMQMLGGRIIDSNG